MYFLKSNKPNFNVLELEIAFEDSVLPRTILKFCNLKKNLDAESELFLYEINMRLKEILEQKCKEFVLIEKENKIERY